MFFIYLLIWLVVGFFSAVQFITRVLKEDVDIKYEESHAIIVLVGTLLGFLTCIVVGFAYLATLYMKFNPNFFKAK